MKNIVIITASAIIALSLIAMLAFSAPPDANQQRFPIPLGETLTYRVTEKSSGKSAIPSSKVVLSEHNFTATTLENGSKAIQHTCREVRSDGATQKWLFYYANAGSAIRALSFSGQRYTPKGILYFHEEAKFGDPFYKFPSDTVHLISVPYLLASTDFAPGKTLSMHTWAQEGPATKINISVCGEERVTVPWKTVNAWKVCTKADTESLTKPMGAMGKIFEMILPEFTIWFDKDTPHRPVKIYGVFGPLTPGKPEYIQELTKVTNN